MPKEKVHIKRFDGVIGVTDAHDLPEGAAYYAENLDIVTQDASFVGLPADEDYGGPYAGGAEVELFEDGDTGVTYSASSGNLSIVSFAHDTKNTTLSLQSSQATGKVPAMASSGQAIHVGMGGTSASTDKPLWAGKVYHDQKSSATSAGSYVVTDSEITSAAFGWCIANGDADVTPDVDLGFPSATNPSGPTSIFGDTNRYDNSVTLKAGRKYRYYASAVYDGSQEAPVQLLMQVDVRTTDVILKNFNTGAEGTAIEARSVSGTSYDDTMSIGGFTPTTYVNSTYRIAMGDETSTKTASLPSEGLETFSFWLKVRLSDTSGNNLPVLNRRVTGVKIYRSEVFIDDTGKTQEAEPAFVKFYPLFDDTDSGTSWTQISTAAARTEHFAEDGTYIILRVADNFPGSYTFEQNTGYAATLEDMGIHWATSCVSNAYHIIGNCWHGELEDVDTWLFRSKPFRYSTFDWSRDYLVLPSKPTALVSYAGRVYAFSASRVYVIDPVAFDIEETWEGVGCNSEKSIVSTESGLFWASRTGIYHFIANEVMPIGLAVNRLYKPSTNTATGVDATKADVGWLNHDTSVTPVCAYSPVHNALLIFYKYKLVDGRSFNAGLMYHVPTQRWSPFTVGKTNNVLNAHTTSLGDVLIGYSTGVFSRVFTNPNTFRRWRFISRQYGEKGAVHKYYHAYISTSDINNVSGEPPAVYFYSNDSAYTDRIPAPATTSLDDNDYLYKYELTENGDKAWGESRTFAIELVDSAGASGIDCSDVTLIRRRINPR